MLKSRVRTRPISILHIIPCPPNHASTNNGLYRLFSEKPNVTLQYDIPATNPCSYPRFIYIDSRVGPRQAVGIFSVYVFFVVGAKIVRPCLLWFLLSCVISVFVFSVVGGVLYIFLCHVKRSRDISAPRKDAPTKIDLCLLLAAANHRHAAERQKRHRRGFGDIGGRVERAI